MPREPWESHGKTTEEQLQKASTHNTKTDPKDKQPQYQNQARNLMLYAKEKPHKQYPVVFKGSASYTVSCCNQRKGAIHNILLYTKEGPHTRYPVVFKGRAPYTVFCCTQRKRLIHNIVLYSKVGPHTRYPVVLKGRAT